MMTINNQNQLYMYIYICKHDEQCSKLFKINNLALCKLRHSAFSPCFFEGGGSRETYNSLNARQCAFDM